MRIQLIFCIVLFSVNSSCQETKKNKPEATYQQNSLKINDEEQQILLIKKEFNKVNSETQKFTVVISDFSGQSAEGGEIKKYYEGKELRKAIIIYYGETGKAILEYYFLKGQPFFLFERTLTYDKPIYDSSSKVVSTEEQRFYFYDNRIIRWMDGKENIKNKKRIDEKQREIIAETKRITESG